MQAPSSMPLLGMRSLAQLHVNPFRPGWREGGLNTASGERYDPSVWSAAIKTCLRQKFGGVQYGASAEVCPR